MRHSGHFGSSGGAAPGATASASRPSFLSAPGLVDAAASRGEATATADAGRGEAPAIVDAAVSSGGLPATVGAAVSGGHASAMSSRRCARRDAVQQHSGAILVSPAQPRHRVRQVRLVAALGHEIEIMIGSVHHIESAGIAGVGVEYVVSLLVKDADAGELRAGRLLLAEVVGDLAGCELLGRERAAEVAVEA